MTDNRPYRKLDIRAFAHHGSSASGTIALHELDRLAEEVISGTDTSALLIEWRIHAEERSNGAGLDEPWLLCEASATLPLVCQRCLDGMPTTLRTHQWFRFVATEAQAEEEDAVAEEDVLALAGPIDVFQLIEDDLLMALPPIAAHTQCAPPAKPQVEDPAFEAALTERKNPFAALGDLVAPKRGSGDREQ